MNAKEFYEAALMVCVKGDSDIHVKRKNYTCLSREKLYMAHARDIIMNNALKTHSKPPMSLNDAIRHYYSDSPEMRAKARISYAMHAAKIAEEKVGEIVSERLPNTDAENLAEAIEAVESTIDRYRELPCAETTKEDFHPQRMFVHAICETMRNPCAKDRGELEYYAEIAAEKSVPKDLEKAIASECFRERKKFLCDRFGLRGSAMANSEHMVVSVKGHVNIYGDAEKEADEIASYIYCGHDSAHVKEKIMDVLSKQEESKEKSGKFLELYQHIM